MCCSATYELLVCVAQLYDELLVCVAQLHMSY